MRKVEVDLEELLDIFFAGLDGDWTDFMASFLMKNCKVTQEDVADYAKKLGETEGYSEEDEEVVLRNAGWYLKELYK